MIGIVAGRLAETFHRPTVIIALGETIAQGSARSIPGFDLYEALKDCSEGLIAYGGHAAAAGLKLSSRATRPSSPAGLKSGAGPRSPTEQLERVITIDAEVPLGVLSLAVVSEIEKLEPHGISNPRPLLLASGLEVVGEPRPVGEKKNHLAASAQAGRPCLQGHRLEPGRERARAAGGLALFDRVHAVDQRVERTAGGSA